MNSTIATREGSEKKLFKVIGDYTHEELRAIVKAELPKAQAILVGVKCDKEKLV